MKQRFSLFVILFVVFSVLMNRVQAQTTSNAFTVRVTVLEKGTNESVMMASCYLHPLEAYTVTNIDGMATFSKIPNGRYTLEVRYVGYEKYQMVVDVTRDLDFKISITPTSLALKEVVVTAQQKASGASTTSIIGRQAIDHLQASSLGDIMQLLPGKQMGNLDLTQQSNLQLRTLVNNNTSAFGSSIVVDGMPLSNNATMTAGGFSSTAFVGTDLRQISADNIDNVEVVRGIPSAEYGDLTSGLVIVHSKVGLTPWQFRAKVNPALQNYSLGKGFRLAQAGIMNFNFDYAKAWGDPRMKTRSYGRYTFNVGHGYNLSKQWHIDTKLRLFYANDWSGKDPDAINDGTENNNKNYSFNLTHNGRISMNRPLMRTLSYTLGGSFSQVNSKNTRIVPVSSGLLPILTAEETGYHAVPWTTSSYLATGNTRSSPANFFAKLNDSFFFNAGKTNQSFKMGVDYRVSWNSGRGYYNENDERPYTPNSDGRPRAFSSYPALHQLSFYAEDNLTWHVTKQHFVRANVGLRFTTQQPFAHVSTTALSPRLNLMYRAAKWIDLRGGIGLNSKTPSLDYLYPSPKYEDHVAANYMPVGDPAAQLLLYHTQVYQVPYSKGMKNATTTKVELGLDLRLPGNRKLSLLAYQDRTPNGFSPLFNYITYYSNVYTPTQGLVLTPGAATKVNFNNPARRDLRFMTTGEIGNENVTVNKGIEFDFDLGVINPINTTIYFNGAYAEMETWQKGRTYSSVSPSLLPATYSAYGLTPFKMVYPSDYNRSIYRQFINTLRMVTHIPRLRMVASFTGQVIWYNYSFNKVSTTNPIGYLTPDLNYHPITPDMMQGFLDLDGHYYAAAPSGHYVRLSDVVVRASDAVPTKTPITWNLSARLTKELGNIGGLSLYVNNALFYEPYLHNSTTTTLSQRNVGSFGYGVELYFNL